MAICRACSSEIIGSDRYCRNCGALVAPVVAEFDDTRRFNPSAPLPAAAPGTPDPTNPLYAPKYAAYVAPQSSSSLRQTATLVNALLRQKFIWALLALMLFTLVGMGIGIGRATRRRAPDFREAAEARRARDEMNDEIVRREYE